MNNVKKWLFLAAAVVALAAFAGPIKTWTSGDIIGSGDLNANFAHIHQTMVGGHGARLVNADVAANANIAVSKINGGGLIPRASVSSYGAACAASPCTNLGLTKNVSGITRSAAGTYVITLSGGVTCAASTYPAGVAGSRGAARFTLTNAYMDISNEL
jgi:hypothetical protein